MTRRPLYASPNGGRRYHATPWCPGLDSYSQAQDRDAPAVTDREVATRGLTPCLICQPRPLLRIVAA